MFRMFYCLLPIFIAGQLMMSLNLSALQPVLDKMPIHEAFVPKFTDAMENQPISRQPPSSIQESIPPQTLNDTQWISGYWAWIEEDQDFSWVCGVWRRPPPKHVWIPGFWSNIDGNWVWAKGFWSPNSDSQYISKIPPQSIDDVIPTSPGPDYFWIRGYWEYNFSTNNYSWLSGAWEKLNRKWILAPASYIWRPEGYVFVPIYWDFPLEERGNAYTCSSTTSPMIIEPDLIIQRLYVLFPDYIFLYHHWWHFHPDWWGNCGCIPPWWFWNDWWAFSWADSWGLWSWWGHPGFFPPFWIQAVLSNQLAPPPIELIEFLKNAPKPNFPLQPGKEPLLPEGPVEQKPLPKPRIPNNVKPGGTLTPPQFPDFSPKPEMVTPPPTPSDIDRHEHQDQPHYIPPPRKRTPVPQYYPEQAHPRYPPNTYPRRPGRPKPKYPPRPQGRRPQKPPKTTPETYYPQERPQYQPKPRNPQVKPQYQPKNPTYPSVQKRPQKNIYK